MTDPMPPNRTSSNPPAPHRLASDPPAPDLPSSNPPRSDMPSGEQAIADPPKTAEPARNSDAAQDRLNWRARRKQAAALRDASFDWLADGFTHQQIAAARKVSVAVVRRDIAKAIRARQAETRESHAQLQIARLTKGLAVVAHHIERGDLSAVGPLVKVVAALDRYHGGEAPPPAREAASEVPALAAPPLALTHAAPALELEPEDASSEGATLWPKVPDPVGAIDDRPGDNPLKSLNPSIENR